MSEYLHVVCAHCNANNRVLRDRLDGGAKCGRCKLALISAQPFELTKAGFDHHLSGNDLPLVVDFWAPWCGPCRMMAPAYEQAAAKLVPQIRLAKLNTDAEPDVGCALRYPWDSDADRIQSRSRGRAPVRSPRFARIDRVDKGQRLSKVSIYVIA